MRTFIIAALVAVAAAGRPAAVHGGYGGGYGRADYYEPRPYHFQYAVDDPHYGPMMAQSEQSNGDGAHVKYYADHYAGYNAEVSYDGYANHPERRAKVVGYAGAGRH
ncbi:adult-specific cuticular protein ACP-20-like [Pollicipes pollicipes]|uniref:adult-specific cuticular protein ACP-20-like n=1 Tax=Pollicipes pollicipes TaxID=41117 RepID=UPI001885136D|nr:adult-specific cuticular protein ACP-20-like [Pollicipes pollicipes]XP_037078138.1 adult-specific cuticular protein ACP-20-like [Pollicipes pollicipes]